MGRKRKVRRSTGPTGPRGVNEDDALLDPINTYADVANSEDEFSLSREHISLDDFNTEGPQTKRQRRLAEEASFLHPDDEEVIDFDDTLEQEQKRLRKQARREERLRKKGKTAVDAEKDEDDEPGQQKSRKKSDKEDEGEEDSRWWGSSKSEYYNADTIETEADAREEEEEAKRLQREKMSKMAEEDFLFDEKEWAIGAPSTAAAADAGPGNATGGDIAQPHGLVSKEVLGDVEIPDDMDPRERYQILTTRYPEFEPLVDEFCTLQPLFASMQKGIEVTSGGGGGGHHKASIESVRFWVLGSYIAALSSYFTLLTSPARDQAVPKTLPPAELRDHAIMDTLMRCRQMWDRVNQLWEKDGAADVGDEEFLSAQEDLESEDLVESEDDESEEDDYEDLMKEMLEKQSTKSKKSKKSTGLHVSKDVEADLDELSHLAGLATSKKRSTSAPATAAAAADSDSDIGEEDSMDARTAEEKARRKKSLRFYTSQIAQRSNRRSGAGRDAGGDMDIPYRERLKDRQARLNAQAERRGRDFGADLDSEDVNEADARQQRQEIEDNEYYDMVAAQSKAKLEQKSARKTALEQASASSRVVEKEEVGEDGKRKITYVIEKNKGLGPKRKKENRNPRVKKRLMYNEKMKKLRSMKPVFQGNQAYEGVKSGIKSGLIRSTKFAN